MNVGDGVLSSEQIRLEKMNWRGYGAADTAAEEQTAVSYPGGRNDYSLEDLACPAGSSEVVRAGDKRFTFVAFQCNKAPYTDKTPYITTTGARRLLLYTYT